MSKAVLQTNAAAERLRAMIRSGQFENGRMPSEPEIAVQLKISRGTVRQALAQLEHEGMISRRQGSGTYVNDRVLNIATRLDEVWDFAEMIQEAGYEPSVKPLRTRLEAASDHLLAKLNLEPGSEVISTLNLFLADGRPAIYCQDVIPGSLLREAYSDEELHGPVYAFLARRCHQKVAFNIAEVRPINAAGEIARSLNLRAGTALHYFEEIGFNPEQQPVIYSKEYYAPDLFSFQVVRRMMNDSSSLAADSKIPGMESSRVHERSL